MRHEYYTSCGRDECDGSCNLCTLAVCKNCGLAEGSLTTECPGKIEDYGRKSDLVYAAQIDYRAGQWVEGCTIHLLSRIVESANSVVAVEAIEITDRFINNCICRKFGYHPFEATWLRPAENHRIRFATVNGVEYCQQRQIIPANKWLQNVPKYYHGIYESTAKVPLGIFMEGK